MSVGVWAWRVTFWRDSDWTRDTRRAGQRTLMRPSTIRHMKWEDQMRRYAASEGLNSWTDMAGDRERWASHTPEFVAWFN